MNIIISDAVERDPSKRAKMSYLEVVADHHRQGRDRRDVVEFYTVRPAMNRIRNRLIPPIPRHIDDVDIDGVWGETWGGDELLLEQDNGLGIVIFASNEDLEVLRRCPDVYMDATFSTTPDPPYKQYFTMHGKYNGRTLCLVSVLMTGQYLLYIAHNSNIWFKYNKIKCVFILHILLMLYK